MPVWLSDVLCIIGAGVILVAYAGIETALINWLNKFKG